jgi:predicted ATPase/class 3 adenylate cyclase
VRVSAGGPPSGVVTFLFTDIEGSTRRWETDAPSMRAALLAHDEVLREAIEAHDGFLFSHTGDGVVAAFASPNAAVDAAIDAQRGLELPVRMGIATGEAELRGGDYFGTVLNRAARVMAAGHGGQVLVADSTAGLLGGVDLMSLGARRLRDVANPITVFQLQATGLRTDFPPLRTINTTPGNLRRAATRLIGRDTEVSAIAQAVLSHRLVTLSGVGGVGKTRLALEVASVVADAFPDGIWVFELAPVVDPAAVPDAVAAVLGITQQAGMTMSESLAVALDGRVRLLVFDNCEHVVDAVVRLIESVVARSDTVKILATSREGLGIANEQLWRVPSLNVGAAVELFAERARTLSDDESAAVEEVCRRLDGIPLAIELAASRMESMTASEVRDRLDHRFKLLVRSRRGLERHQTLRQAVAWSYDLLNGPERTLLEQSSVFAGGFDVQSVCAITGLNDEFEMLDLLDALVRKSLLVADRSTGRTRFSMLETIREFAEEQLVARGVADEVGSAHAHHFAAREAEILALWDSPRQREAYDWFSIELFNLRTAFRWAADHDDLNDAVAIATYAGLLGFGVENYEPVAWTEELIEPAQQTNHPRILTLCVIATLCWMAGRLDNAIRYSKVGEKILVTGRDTTPYGMEAWAGAVYFAVGQPERWAQFCEAQLERRGDNHVYVRACRVFALTFSGAVDEAAVAAKGLIEAGAATRNPYLHSFAIAAAAFTFDSANDADGVEVCRRGLTIAQESGNRFNESILAVGLARLEAAEAVTVSALDHVSLAFRNYHDSGNVGSVGTPLGMLSAFLTRLGRFEPAATIAGFAFSPVSVGAAPELPTAIAKLREALGDQAFESRYRIGEAMTMAAMAAYVYDQIDWARTELEQSR